MSDYGLTSTGFVRKRLDKIIDEIHTDLSDSWGVNTKLNPQSYLNVIVTAVSDKIAELWEVAEENYHAMYPSSANGISLDNAAQYGGTVRKNAAKSYYPIHCTGIDGTVLPLGTSIAAKTNPAVNFVVSGSETQREITRDNFNKVELRIASIENQKTYSVGLNNTLYSYTSGQNATQSEILDGIAATITSADWQITRLENSIRIEDKNVQRSNKLVLTENLTTVNVTSIITFASEEFGDVYVPDGIITNIVKTAAGFESCVNLSGYIAGRMRQTDAEFRQSYVENIFRRSSRMLASIESAIRSNVQGVKSVKVYENDTDEIDSDGRWPHSIEVIVDGGDSTKIAQQILDVKAAGISTFGDVEVEIHGEDEDVFTIRFNRPQPVYCWFKATVTISQTQLLPANYAELIKGILIKHIDALRAGNNVTPQRYMAEIYSDVPGIDYIDIFAHGTIDEHDEPPTEFTERSVAISPRQIAVTSESRIEVTLIDE